MPDTGLGIPYPASTDQYQPHVDFADLATAVDALIVADRDRLDDLETNPAWASYTPVWTASTTAPALGNGTLTGNYRQTGATVQIRITLTLGSTSTVGSGTYRFTLPVGAKVDSLLIAQFFDASSSGRYSGACHITATGATGDNMRIHVDSSLVAVGATVPVIPASGDRIMLAGTYEIA